MIASVHVADVGKRAALGLLRKVPKPGSIQGLRKANVAVCAPLGTSRLPRPDLGRVGLVAFWDDDAALDAFLSHHPLAARLAGGWHVRLAPLRAFGSWPGLPADTPRPRKVDHDGPAAVLTLGRLRLTQAVRFLRTSAKAEARVVGSPGLTWASGMARPPFVATCSLWESSDALADYAYGADRPAHPDAITEDRRKGFHHESAFIRFRPYASEGRLDGRNPLNERWLSDWSHLRQEPG
jgi:hypothetical protein